MSGWIAVPVDLSTDIRTRRLARSLGINRNESKGLITSLWTFAFDHAGDGDLTGYDAADLADACDHEGDADALLAALIECGWIEQTGKRLTLPDWNLIVNKLLDQRSKASARTRNWRHRKAGIDPNDPRDGHVTVTEPSRDAIYDQEDQEDQGDRPEREESAPDGADALTQDLIPADGGDHAAGPRRRDNGTVTVTPQPISDDFWPNAHGLTLARRHGMTDDQQIADQVQRFINWHKARGTKLADWQPEWLNWCGHYRRPGPKQTQDGRIDLDAQVEDVKRKMGLKSSQPADSAGPVVETTGHVKATDESLPSTPSCNPAKSPGTGNDVDRNGGPMLDSETYFKHYNKQRVNAP